MDQAERELKGRIHLDINLWMFSVAITIFIFILATNPAMLRSTLAFPIQITFAIPLFITSIFARSKLVRSKKTAMWDNYGTITFLLGYACIVNVIGILLAYFINLKIGLIFFLFSIFISLIYSVLDVIEDDYKWKRRVVKDLGFIILLIVGGILPAMGFF
ncbi:MAG: hypothetical protein WC758_06260 [Candidatus Woesearchaeota archaeon]|jgi:hypothetical protein